MAETIFQKMVDEVGLGDEFVVDSAGLIGYHEGEGADSRMREHAFQHGYRITHRSRPVCQDDFYNFDMIIGMDGENMRKLMRLRPADAPSSLWRMTEFCREHSVDEVPDPYYDGAAGFEYVIELLEDACAGLLASCRE